MRKLLPLVGWCLAWMVGASVARGAGPTDLAQLFPKEADVFVTQTGLVRLSLPPEVLSSCRPDLSDLRLFDRSGAEVPFFVDSQPPPERQREIEQIVEARIMDARREEIRRKNRPPLQRETYDLATPQVAPAEKAWELLVETERKDFVRRIEVYTVTPEGERILGVGASIFDLGGGARHKTGLSLPPFKGDHLSVMIEGEDGYYLEPRFRLRSARVLETSAPATVALDEVDRYGREGVTTLTLARPAGIVPDALRVSTSTGTFDRSVRVWDERAGFRDELVGSGELFRAESRPPVESLELPFWGARGEQLRVEIDDGDSPMLADLAFSAVVRRPVLIFSLPVQSAGTAAGIVRFGGGRAWAPHYDLTHLLPETGRAPADARAGTMRLYDPAAFGEARLGPVRDNPAFDRSPALAFAMRPGSPVDVRLYTYRRGLHAENSTEGLSHLRLQPEDIARCRADLADLRVVDGQGRQWPYLVDAQAAREWQEVKIETAPPEKGTSRYTLGLPASPLPIDAVGLEVDAPFFDRPYRLIARVGSDDERALSQGRLMRDARRGGPVTVTFPAVRCDEIALLLENGDDAPLRVQTAHVRVIQPDLFVTAPAGDYRLLLGNPSVEAPHYEIAQVREVVLAVASAPLSAGPLERNPEYSLAAKVTTGTGPRKILQQVLLWGGLVIAVGVMAFLTFRLARGEKAGG
jgi:hypothetical protein